MRIPCLRSRSVPDARSGLSTPSTPAARVVGRLLVALALLGIGSCRDAGPLSPLAPELPRDAVGIAGNTNRFFTFLQPMVQKPTVEGRFNRALSPSVEICRTWDPVTAECTSVVATFTRDRAPSQTPTEVVRVTGKAYAVNWNTGSFEGLAGHTYRVTVKVGRHTLGRALVAVSQGAPKNAPGGADYTVVDRSVLLIQFHIGEGALREALEQSGECNDCTEEVVTSTDTATVTTPSKDAGAFFPAGAIPADVGEVTVTINRIRPTADQPCLPTTLEQAEGCYRFETEPFLEDGFTTDVTVGVCLDPSKDRDDYQLHKFSERRADEGIVALKPTTENFLDCSGFSVARAGGGTLLHHAASKLGGALGPLARLLGPTALYAGDVGEAGLTGSFSRIGWLRALTVEAVQGDDAVAASGAYTLPWPTVRVMAGHGPNAVPAESVAVVFKVTRGEGTVSHERLSSVTVRTNKEGYAWAIWTLGMVGDNTVTASLPEGVSVNFTATALEPAPVVNVRAGTTSTTRGGTPTVGTIQEAVSLVAVGGRIVVYDGTYRERVVYLNRAFTIEAASGARPVVDADGAWSSFFIRDVPAGTSSFRGLEFRNAGGNNIVVLGRFDRVVVENSRFHPTVSATTNNGLGYNGGVGTFGATGNELLVQNSTFTGGDIGVHANNSSRLVVRGNTFSGQLNAAVHVGHGSSGRIEGNTIGKCGLRWCIGLFTAGSYEIVDNTVNLDMEHPSYTPIHVHAQSAVVQGNRVIGTGGTLDPQDQNSFPIRWAALHFYQTGSATVTGNTVQRAMNGLWFSETAATGQDNAIAEVGTGIGAHHLPAPGAVRIQRNDISKYTHPFNYAHGQNLPDFTCNWWGDSGPRSAQWWMTRGIYAPWSPASIAGNADAPCGTDGFATVDVVVPGTTGTAGQPTVDNFPDALIWAADGGTLRVQAGEHTASRVWVRRPVTIEGAAATRPTLDARAEDASFFVQEVVGTGAVTFRNLRFQNAKMNNIFVHKEYDQVLIEHAEFFPGRDPAATHLGYWSGVNIGDARGNGVTIRNSSFQGGDIGVNTWNSPGLQLTVQDNTFSGHANAALHLGSGRVKAEGNTITGCGASWCLGVFGAEAAEILNNTLTVDIAQPTQHAISIGGAQSVRIQGNQVTGTGSTINIDDQSTAPIRWAAVLVANSPDFTVSGNTIRNAWHGVATGDGSGVVDGNTVYCGNDCIVAGPRGRDVRISNNILRLETGRKGGSGISAGWEQGSGTLLIEGNQIVAADAPSDPADGRTYPFRHHGIGASTWDQSPTAQGATVTVRNNYVKGAQVGISTWHGGVIVGSDNTLDTVHQAFVAWDGSSNTVNRSDVLNYFSSLNGGKGPPDGRNATMDVRCNWWGPEGGPPQNRWGDAATLTVTYEPWATQRIAGKPEVSCP